MSSRLIPIACLRLIEWLKRAELYAILFFVVFANLHEVSGEVFVVVRVQIVFASVLVATAASADGHPPWCAVRECLKDGVWAVFENLEHNLALRGVSVPMELTASLILESFHLSSDAFAVGIVMFFAVGPVGVISASYVVAEYIPVESSGTGHPSHYLVYLGIAPFAAHVGPPAKAYSPSLDGLSLCFGANGIG